MMVTDICRDDITYNDNEWGHQPPDYEEMINKYNNSKNRFLYYVWGLYVTAYAKRNLASGILNLGFDYLYADTDSVKCIHYDKHKDYFESYNKMVENKLIKMCEFHKIDISMIKPKTIENEEKLIGVWDFDGHYQEFKYLGAKRYMVMKDNGTYSFTVAGCSKKLAIPYMCQGLCSDIKTRNINYDPLDKFEDELFIPKEYTCKNTHTYIDYEQQGILKDYLGVEGEFHELSSVHLEAAEFTLSLTAQFIDYIMGLRGVL